DHEPARFVLEHTIHARDRLHQAVPVHRLVEIYRVQAGRIETGQPHVAHDYQLERIARVLVPPDELLARGLGPYVRLPCRRIGGRAGHYDLDRSGAVIITMPRWPQRHDVLVQLDADPPAHADDHALAVHDLEPLLEVAHKVLGDQSQPVLGADHRLE